MQHSRKHLNQGEDPYKISIKIVNSTFFRTFSENEKERFNGYLIKMSATIFDQLNFRFGLYLTKPAAVIF